MSVNKVIVLGRLGQDPELKHTAGGSPVTNFSLATNESWTDKQGQKQERTEWHRIVVWGKLAELCSQYLSKGRQVYVEGRLQTRSWEDNNGQKRYTTEIQANTVQFLGSVNEGAGDRSGSSRNSETTSSPDSSPSNMEGYQVPKESAFAADDIPF